MPVKSEDSDTPGALSVDALKLARKVMPKGLGELRIGLDGKRVLQDGTALPRPEDVNPPRLFSIIRDAHKNRKFRFGIDVGLLKDLCDAIGTDEVLLELEGSYGSLENREYELCSGVLRMYVLPK